MSKRLTKQAVQTMMDTLERKPTVENMQAAAKLLNVGFEGDIDGGLIYRGAYCPDHAELVDEILCDLGNRRNGL
jgi:hypothetical protein